MTGREPTFADMVASAREESARARAAAPPPPAPPEPVLPRLVEDGVLSPTGRMYWEVDGLLGMQRMQQIGLDGAELLVNPLGEGYVCATYLDGPTAGDRELRWYDADVVRRAAERAEPVCRSITIVSLLEDDDGRLLLFVDGDGLIWPPVPRAR